MEPPGLVRWCPPENDDTSADLFDFEIGGKDDSFDREPQAGETRRTILGLLQERNRLLVKLRELSSNEQVQGHEQRNETRSGFEVEANDVWKRTHHLKFETRHSNSSGIVIETSGKFDMGLNHDSWLVRRMRLSQESRVDEGKTVGTLEQEVESYLGDESGLINRLRQANHKLFCVAGHLQQLLNNSQVNEYTFEDTGEEKRHLGELITRNKGLERSLWTSEPLLTIQLDEYMKSNLSETEILEIERGEKNSMDNSNTCNNKSGFLTLSKVECGVQTDTFPQEIEHRKPGNGKEREKNFQNLEKKDMQLMNGSILSNQQGGAQEEMVAKKKYVALEKECNDVKEKLKKVAAEKAKSQEDVDQLREHYGKQENMQRMQVEKLEQDIKQYQNMIVEFQTGEQSRKRDIDQVLLQARDVLERERQEKFASMSEQKVLRQQIENLSKTMKTMQVKNDELVRFQCNQEDQVDDFKRLKKLIQENGLPTIEQVIILQRQNESLREDLMNERKEKERLLSIKDKLRRDLDSTQSRISSLQEQVYKYREHIYFLQQRTKQDNPGSPITPIPVFEATVAPPSPTAMANTSRLYGANTPQYINEGLLQGSVPQKYPPMPFPEGRKGPLGKHVGEGQGAGKQWQFQQQNTFPGKFGRQLSLDAVDWKQRASQGQAPQQQSWATSTESSFNCSPGRHNSSGSYSSMRSGSSLSGSSEEGLETNLEKQGQYSLASRRHNARNGDELRPLQTFGPSSSPFEAWPRQSSTSASSRMPNNRTPRRYSSPVGNGLRSPSADYWPPQQHMSSVPKPWQTSVDQNQFPDSIGPGLRQGSDPWQQSTTLASSSQAQNIVVTSGDASSYMSGGFCSR